MKAFEKIIKFAEENNINLILETEHEKVKEDIQLLKSLRNNINQK